MIDRLRTSFTKVGILQAQAIEARLMKETWLAGGYDLISWLQALQIPALVPQECAAHIAQAIIEARLVKLPDSGILAFLERTDEVDEAVRGFL